MSGLHPFDAVAVGVVVIDAHAKFVYANAAACTLLGYGAVEILTLTALDPRLRLTHADGTEYTAEDCPTLRALATGRPVHDETLGIIRPDGARCWLRIGAIPRAGEVGSGMEVVVSFTDVSREVEAAHTLRQRDEQLRTVVMNAPIILSAYDMSGLMTLHTGGAVGLSDDEPDLIGTSFFDRYAHRPDIVEKFRSALAGETHTASIQLGPLSFEVHAGPQRDENGRQTGVIVLAIDSTAQVKLREEAERAREAAEHLAALRSDLVASVSHELRTPLTAIIGYGELLLGRWTHMSDMWRRQAVERINQAAQRQLRLVEEILMLSQMDWAGVALSGRHMRLTEALDEAVDALQVTYAGQVVYREGPDDLVLWADSSRVLQILANLLDNAAKYSPDGRPMKVTWCREDTMAAIRVQDQGAGIPDQGRDALFTRFGRIPGSAIRAGRVGTGLGLYLARRLAEAMHGSLSLEQTGPEGSVFLLRLPVEPATGQE